MLNTIPEFLKYISQKYQDKTALQIRRFLRSDKFSYLEVKEISFKITSYLLKNGLKKNDCVLIWAPNMPEWVLAFFGIVSGGMVAVPVGTPSTWEVIKKYIRQTEPKLIFTSKYHPFSFEKDKLLKIKIIFLEDLISLIEKVKITKLPHLQGETLAEIVYTSGTTGEPKGIMISHQNILYEIENLLKTIPLEREYRMLSILPLSHVMEQIIGVFTPLSRGGAVYYLSKVNLVTIKKALQRWQITHLAVVPQILRMFLDNIEHEVDQQKRNKSFNFALSIAKSLPFKARRILFRDLHSQFGGKLFTFAVASAPLDIRLAQTWEKLGIRVVEGYGASETTGAITTNSINERNLGSVGKILPGVNIKISQEGEILAKGGNVTCGYFQNPQENKKAFDKEGFFKTGDIGYFDNKGYLYLTGRKKFRIISSSGDKVYPEDIEKKLNNHPDVWDSCVFGTKNQDSEIVSASLILNKNHKKTLGEIIREVNNNLEPHQKIMSWSCWPQKDFPRLYTLKVNRDEISRVLQSKKIITPNNQSKTYPLDPLKSIVAKVCKVKEIKIKENDVLMTDLKMDSLKRVELASLIEEEYGTEVSEEAINNQTTLGTLRKIIQKETKTVYPYDIEKISNSIRNPLSRKLKVFFQELALFPILRIFVKIKIVCDIDLKDLPKPAVFAGNHPSPGIDAACFLASLPRNIREKLVGVAGDWAWTKYFGILGFVCAHLGGALPVNRTGRAIQKSLETFVDFLDEDYCLYIFPEGGATPLNKPLGPLHKGVEALLEGSKISIIPFYISGDLNKAFPADRWGNHLIPHGFAKVTIRFGKPFSLKNFFSERALEVIEQKITMLKNSKSSQKLSRSVLR